MTNPPTEAETRILDDLSILYLERNEDRNISVGEAEELARNILAEYTVQKCKEAYLAHFSYVDWDIGDDDVLRIGDYINCNHQQPHDGYKQNFEGQIVAHHVNGLPVVIYNVESEDPDNSGDYSDLQSLMMDGWEFSRIAELNTSGDSSNA